MSRSEWTLPSADELRGRLAELRRAHRVPALAATVIERDGPAVCAADGIADLSSGRAVGLDTVFGWYSLTKIITATACVRELDRLGVDLDARVSDIAPAVVPVCGGRQAERWGVMTVRQLVSHGAGFGDRQLHARTWFLDPGQPWPEPRAALREVLARRAWLSRSPGARFRYSNLGYAVLGEVLAELTGVPFRELVVERVLRAAGAGSAGFDPPDGERADVARGYVRRWSRMGVLVAAIGGFRDGTACGPYERIKTRRPVFSAHGGLWGPIGDLVPLLREHLAAAAPFVAEADSAHEPAPEQADRLRGDQPSDARLLRDMQRVHRPCAGRRGHGGLGWCLDTGLPLRLAHGGRGPGFTTEMVVLPEVGRAAAVLGNATFDAKEVVAGLLRTP